MRTALIILGGFALLALLALAGRWLSGAGAGVVRAAKYFIPLWFVIAVINLWVGVSQAGYTVREELPILAVVFAIPAAAAVVLWWRLARR